MLNLHGAMVAEDTPDAESEILRRVRATVGYEIPIAVTLDFHANIGQEMIALATIVTTYDTYPHTDAAERAMEAVGLLQRTVTGEIDPVMALSETADAAGAAGDANRLRPVSGSVCPRT
ncbi:MAG: M81 family metallopeptidase [Thermomicrobiales bacterium]